MSVPNFVVINLIVVVYLSLDQSGVMVLKDASTLLICRTFMGAWWWVDPYWAKLPLPPLYFLYTWTIVCMPPTQETYCSTTTCYGGNRMQRSGLECHPRATECWVSRHWQGLLALLSPWQLNYSLKERKAQGTLLISQWDCWLSSH